MKLKALALAVATLAVAAAAHAVPVVNTNVRPVAVGSSGSETSLQTVLNNTFGLNNVSATADQSTAGLWGSATGVPSSSVPTLALEATNGAGSQTFGIWFGTDTINLLMVPLLLGAATTGTVASPVPDAITLQMNYGFLKTSGDGCGTAINCVPGLFDSRINPLSFGFYFQGGGNTAYSIDSITNPKRTRFLAYSDMATNWIFAFEDGGDFDYNDMVVKVESIKEVPEPGSLALLGLGLAGLAAVSRRKQKQA